MKILLIASKVDSASMNMAHFARSTLGKTDLWINVGVHEVKLLYIDGRSVDANNLDEQHMCDMVIFLSKHASVSRIPSLCIHTQGNWGDADLGGSENTLGVTPVVLKNQLYAQMYEKNTTNFDVVQEATHHGPDLGVPAIFFEIGSTQKEWDDPTLGAFMVEVLFSVLGSYRDETSELPVIFGIGGSHTCSNFNRLSYEGKALIGHVCPNYALNFLDKDMIDQALQKSTLLCETIVDWKSLNSSQRSQVTSLLGGRPWKKLKQFKGEVDNLG